MAPVGAGCGGSDGPSLRAVPLLCRATRRSTASARRLRIGKKELNLPLPCRDLVAIAMLGY